MVCGIMIGFDKIEKNSILYFLFNKMLCCKLLPCQYVLPSRALLLIREYSRPLTNPDWRNSEPIITMFKLYLKISPATSELHYIILTNIKMTEWYNILCRIV